MKLKERPARRKRRATGAQLGALASGPGAALQNLAKIHKERATKVADRHEYLKDVERINAHNEFRRIQGEIAVNPGLSRHYHERKALLQARHNFPQLDTIGY